MKSLKAKIFELFMLSLGAFFAAFAIAEFLLPISVLDGGLTGISIILNLLTKQPLGLYISIINIPFLILGYKQLGKGFLIKAIYSIILFSFLLNIFENWSFNMTDNELLGVVYGGVLLGIGVGLVLRFGGCLDGTEIVALLLSKKTSFSTGQVIFFFNIIIYTVAGFLFGVDRALFSLLTYFITFKIIDMVENGMEQCKAVMIIANDTKEISHQIYERLGRTTTLINGKGLVSGPKGILYVVVTRMELFELKKLIKETDASSFITVTDVSEIIGTHVKKSDKKIVEQHKKK